MRKHPKFSRSGPGLISVMARSAVLAGSAEIEPGLARPRRRNALRTTAAARYDQLLELMSEGVLTGTEFQDAVERLTSQATRSSIRHTSPDRGPGTDQEAQDVTRPH
jgi:hypothetical protein